MTIRRTVLVGDRHIVQISSADGSRPIAIVLAIANYRLEPTERTVITFNEVPVGAPETLRAWFYPGRSWGQEFVYPKRRALELASTSRVIVPAIAVMAADPDLKTVPLVAITLEQEEMPVAAVIQQIVRDLREQYTLGFAPAPRTPAGVFRPIASSFAGAPVTAGIAPGRRPSALVHDDALDDVGVRRGRTGADSTGRPKERPKEHDAGRGEADEHERERGDAGEHHGRGYQCQCRQHGELADALVGDEHGIPQLAQVRRALLTSLSRARCHGCAQMNIVRSRRAVQ